MLRLHCEQMDERAALFGTTVPENGFVFSLEPDCANAIPPDYCTKRVAELKDHLGIADKSPEVIELENKAFAFRRQAPTQRPAGKTGPAPTGAKDGQDLQFDQQSGEKTHCCGTQSWTSTARFLRCVNSLRASYSTPASTSPASHSAKVTDRKCW